MKLLRLLAALSAAVPVVVLADHPADLKLGTVRFEVSGAPTAREHVVRGVKLVHHMMYTEGDREFAAAIAAGSDGGISKPV